MATPRTRAHYIGYQEARVACREWLEEFALVLEETRQDESLGIRHRQAAVGGLDFVKDAFAQLNLYS